MTSIFSTRVVKYLKVFGKDKYDDLCAFWNDKDHNLTPDDITGMRVHNILEPVTNIVDLPVIQEDGPIQVYWENRRRILLNIFDIISCEMSLTHAPDPNGRAVDMVG